MNRETVNVLSPVNIALIKYWGKADEIAVLPTTTSLSITLTDLWTKTSIRPAKTSSFWLNDQPMTTTEKERLTIVLKYFPDEPFTFRSQNNFPTAAGLASSASGMAALTVALDAYFNTQLSFEKLVEITRKGSGSAVRSLVDGFALWHQDGQVTTLDNPFSDWMMLIVVVSDLKKAVSSRAAMKLTQSTAPLYQTWRSDSAKDLQNMLLAIHEKNEVKIGEIMEQNSERLHAIMRNSQPPIVYQQPISLEIVNVVKTMRAYYPMMYTTMDAGPNVKILVKRAYAETVKKELEKRFPCLIILSRIGGKTHVI
jgi:diphosphomevalonate decarboxylase